MVVCLCCLRVYFDYLVVDLVAVSLILDCVCFVGCVDDWLSVLLLTCGFCCLIWVA